MVTAATIHIQPMRPPYPSSMEPLRTDTIPAGSSSTTTSSGQSDGDPLHQLRIGSAGEARLHQVPVAEQHGVGHRAQEARAHQEPGEAQPRSPRRRTRRHANNPITPTTGAIRSSRGELAGRLVVDRLGDGRSIAGHRGHAAALRGAATVALARAPRRVATYDWSRARPAANAITPLATFRTTAPVPESPAPDTTDSTAMSPYELRSNQP